ncbi:hypothetical protein [Caproiciproducens sp.]
MLTDPLTLKCLKSRYFTYGMLLSAIYSLNQQAKILKSELQVKPNTKHLDEQIRLYYKMRDKLLTLIQTKCIYKIPIPSAYDSKLIEYYRYFVVKQKDGWEFHIPIEHWDIEQYHVPVEEIKQLPDTNPIINNFMYSSIQFCTKIYNLIRSEDYTYADKHKTIRVNNTDDD